MWTCKEFKIERSKLYELTGEITETMIENTTMTDREVLRLLLYFLNDRDQSTLTVEPLYADSDAFRRNLRQDGVNIHPGRSYGYRIEHTVGDVTIRYHLEDVGPDSKPGLLSGLMSMFK